MPHKSFGVSRLVMIAGWLAGAGLLQGQVPQDYQEVLNFLGRTGDFKADVLKVNVPRTDLKVVVQGVPVPTAFGFGGWVALTKGSSGRAVMMGDLVLLQEEVNPVLTALLDNGLDVTALHNHFFWEEPRVFYLHLHGMGAPGDLARRLKPALDLIGRKPGPGAAEPALPGWGTGGPPLSVSGSLSAPALARIVGWEGEALGSVYKITVGRGDIDLRDMGAAIGTRMGLNSWAAFFGSDSQAVVAGDIAMLEDEVPAVLKALRAHGLDIVAIHQHMSGMRPVIIFLHYWGRGPAAELAAGFKSALDASVDRVK